MKRPGKTNKKVLAGPFLEIEITEIDNFASFLTGTHKKNV